MDTDRRKHRRARLRLLVAHLEGDGVSQTASRGLTDDISPGGMHFAVPLDGAPHPGAYLLFELSLPAGEGHSALAGRVRGTGQVLRTEPSGRSAGVAVRFIRPPTLHI
jgi:hypothetical protein